MITIIYFYNYYNIVIIIMEDVIVKVSFSINCNCGHTRLVNYMIYKSRKKHKAKATNKLRNKKINSK